MEENKNTIAVSLENLDAFKSEMEAVVDNKIAAAPSASVTFATTEQIKALFAETPANGTEENA